ncbi:MAG: hypothetical protein CL609_18325 [Anaerolineaceae bacterium]|nr:hypothetical protein [Anaerolineaceae bacterium]
MVEKNKNEIRTSVFLRKLLNAPEIENFIESNSQEMEHPSFDAYITNMCKKTGKVPEQVIKNSAIERTYGHQLFNGTRKPSRDKVIQLAFGFNLDLEETQKLLQIAQKNPLYPKIKRDAAIIYYINKHKDIFEMQYILQSLKLTLLGGD